jgi:hypothetical protein
MTWAKLDDGLYDDPRTDAAGLHAMGLFAVALSYMGRYHTDGWITLERCRRLAGAQHGRRLALRLVAAGLWETSDERPDAFRLVGWEALLLSAEEVEARSARAAEAGRRGGQARAERARQFKGQGQDRGQGEHQGPEVDPLSHPEPCLGSFSGNAAEALETGQPTRAPDPDPIPTRPDSARARTRDEDLPLFKGIGEGLSTVTPMPASGTRAKRSRASGPSPEDPSTLTPRERAVYDAIAADVSLRPITRGVCALVRDLCELYPRLDVAREVRKAGAWMRGDPIDRRRRKSKGGPFLQHWMEGAEEREAPTRPAETAPIAPRPRPGNAYPIAPIKPFVPPRAPEPEPEPEPTEEEIAAFEARRRAQKDALAAWEATNGG